MTAESWHQRLRRLVKAGDYPAALALLRAPAPERVSSNPLSAAVSVARQRRWQSPTVRPQFLLETQPND